MMMKIHTTQNLNSLKGLKSTNNSTIPSEEIRLNYSEQMRNVNNSLPSTLYNDSVSFRGKKQVVEHSKKVINKVSKKVGDIAKEANPETKRGDKFMDSPFFHKVLDFCEFETVVTATIAAVACTLRAFTIGCLPAKDENTKINNKYAMGHALASGLVGLFTAIALTMPFKMGANYTKKHLKQNLSKKTLERMHPQLDLASIGKDGARKAMEEWKTKNSTLAFCEEIKNCAKLPEFKNLADVSEQTFNKILKVDVDWAAQKGKSFNDIVLKDGSKLYDKISMSRLGTVVEEEGFGKSQVLFKDMDRGYLEKLIADSKGTKWGELDINSVYKDKQVTDFRSWKDVNGKEWKLDLDEIFVSSPYETSSYRPRISGEKRFDKKEGVYKFRTYQTNGVDDKLGTKIDDEMIRAEEKNEVLDKALVWGPDLLFRIPLAMGTVALIPWVLKHCLGLQKVSKKQETPSIQATNSNQQVAFKGNKDPKKANWFIRMLGKQYGERLLNSEKVSNATDKLNKLPGRTTQHMTVAGSLLTSGMYVQQTLNKKELDPDKRKTLAINQTLGFIIPTIAAYSVDRFLINWVKDKEYRFAGRQQQKIDIAKLEGKDIKQIEEMAGKLGKKLKGVRILADLVTFTLIYRYVVPVLITPLANKLGDKWNAHIKAKKEAEQLAMKQAA